MRFLGLDVGDRRIGVAVSDETGTLARPVEVVRRTGGDADVEAVLALVRRLAAEVIVAGLPLNMDATLGEQARKVLDFAAALRERGLTVELWDERLSTRQAGEILRQLEVRGPRARAREDAVAAAVILQGFLNHRREDRAAGDGRGAGDAGAVRNP